MTRSLGQIILDLGTTYQSQIAFRDLVLNTSQIGRRFVKLYYRINPKMLNAARRNPTLLGQAIHTWFIIAPFVQAVVAASDSETKERRPGQRPIRFTRATHQRLIRLLRAIGNEGKDKTLRRDLKEVEAELRRYVGQTSEEVLRTLNRGSR